MRVCRNQKASSQGKARRNHQVSALPNASREKADPETLSTEHLQGWRASHRAVTSVEKRQQETSQTDSRRITVVGLKRHDDNGTRGNGRDLLRCDVKAAEKKNPISGNTGSVDGDNGLQKESSPIGMQYTTGS